MIKKEIIIPFERVISRFEDSHESLKEVKLSEKQESTKEEIEDAFAKETTVLLHGITGSGKTGNLHLADSIIHSSRKTILYLLPEIALNRSNCKSLKSCFRK